jgi:hypothetical protein
MTNLLVLFLGAIMMVIAMVCANSVEMFRATVCVSLIVMDICLLFFAFAVRIEGYNNDDDETLK